VVSAKLVSEAPHLVSAKLVIKAQKRTDTLPYSKAKGEDGKMITLFFFFFL
jgi:hypothetical protein